MAKNYEIQEYMHNSIYDENTNCEDYAQRKANIYFSEPELGINDDTGILLFIAGYGGHANSNVYKKMREQFADRYNLVTIQCDYFGYEFMQDSKGIITPEFDKNILKQIFSQDEMSKIYETSSLDFNKMVDIGSNYDITINVNENLSDESNNNFNDMGVVQALDNIVSVLKVMSIIYENGYIFNTKKVILYGQSHGAYLSYLCNRFCPNLFTNLIDNSALLLPQYLISNRCLSYQIGKLKLNTTFDYFVKQLDIDKQLLDLKFLYSNFKNNCNIISYHGTTDNLISHLDKKKFCSIIGKCNYNEITSKQVDGKVFRSTNHSLDADLLELFDYSISNFKFTKNTFLDLENEVIIKTNKNDYCINYENILPLFKVV